MGGNAGGGGGGQPEPVALTVDPSHSAHCTLQVEVEASVEVECMERGGRGSERQCRAVRSLPLPPPPPGSETPVHGQDHVANLWPWRTSYGSSRSVTSVLRSAFVHVVERQRKYTRALLLIKLLIATTFDSELEKGKWRFSLATFIRYAAVHIPIPVSTSAQYVISTQSSSNATYIAHTGLVSLKRLQGFKPPPPGALVVVEAGLLSEYATLGGAAAASTLVS